MNGYVDRLNAAWELHLAPREPDAPTVISTFAGCGGSSLGYSMAGYRELLAVEWDQNAVDTFRLNFPDVPVYHGDIAALSVDECLSMTGLQPGELDVFDGSPPCQGFSTAGKRQMDDPRNGLFREYVRLLRGLMPRVFVMENVSGMVKGKMKLVFAEILRELKASGYVVSARLMNAMYFDVPQSRQRMIFVGVREDLGIAPSHPVAVSRPVTVRDALPYAHKIGTAPPHRDWVASSRNVESTLTIATVPSPTIVKTMPNKGVGFVLTNQGELRAYSDQELATLGSFPTAFKWLVNGVSERIGNSVPPLFMWAIAEHIRAAILLAPVAMAAD
jgi:DNA (cytosine-5)-methyltransferase 1